MPMQFPQASCDHRAEPFMGPMAWLINGTVLYSEGRFHSSAPIVRSSAKKWSAESRACRSFVSVEPAYHNSLERQRMASHASSIRARSLVLSGSSRAFR